MIISPPFLLRRTAGETDENYVARCMPASSVDIPGTNVSEGSFPVSFNLGWHNGLHLEAPIESNNNVATVRAVADGEIVFARRPTPRNSDVSHPLNYNPYGEDPRWTDDGCVIIRHTTEIGAVDRLGGMPPQQGAPISYITNVVFLSVYMHLSELRGAAHAFAGGVTQNKRIRRKGEIGVAGSIYGAPNHIHLEIICDDENLDRLVGRTTGTLNTSTDGRVDSVFGEIYFSLEPGAPFFPQKPPLNTVNPSLVPMFTLGGSQNLYVGISYSNGDGAASDRGNATVTTYTEDGGLVGPSLIEVGGEYSLHREVTATSTAYPAAARPAESAVYELLRFGRVLSTQVLTPHDVPHWRQVRYPGGVGWVNLNGRRVRKFSDSDFPPWKKWALVNDDLDADSRCESRMISHIIENPRQANTRLSRDELTRRLQLPSVQKNLERTICRVPTEWDKASASARWQWLQTDNDVGLTGSDWDKFLAHVCALAFDWPVAETGIGSLHWHFHPKEFIAHFRKCGWRSVDELSQIYSTRTTPAHILRQHSVELNRMMRKYLVQSPLRQSHFLGQGAVESTFLTSMQEKSMSGTVTATRLLGRRINPASTVPESQLGHWYGAVQGEDDPWFRLEKFNSSGGRISGSYSWKNGNMGDVDAQKFRGRGFKQLTGLDNYTEYWIYRGWLRRDSFDARWWTDPHYPRSPNLMRLRAATVNDPHRVSETPENCMDSGGWYMIYRRPRVMSTIDSDNPAMAQTPQEKLSEERVSRAVTYAINGGYLAAADRLIHTRTAKEVLL